MRAPPGREELARALAGLNDVERRLLELSLRDHRPDDEVAIRSGVPLAGLPLRRAALVNSVAVAVGRNDPQGALATLQALRVLPADAWEPPPEPPPPRLPEWARDRSAFAAAAGTALLLALPGALVVYMSFNAGGFFAGTVATVAAALLLALLLRVSLAEHPLAGAGPALVAGAGALGLLTVWTLASAAWSDADARPLLEFDRALLYLTLLVLCGSLLRTAKRVRVMVRLVAAGIVAVATIGLITRVLPEVWPIGRNLVDSRLSYPITYWNGLGVLAALGLTLCFGLTADPREPRASRALAAGAMPLLGAALLLTFSRGAIAVAIVGILVVAIAGRARSLLPALLVTGPATAVAVIAAYRADLLGTADYTTAAAVSQGHRAAAAIAGCAAGAAAVRAMLLRLDDELELWRPPPLPSRGRLIAIGAGAAVALVLVLVAAGAPGYVGDQYDRFVNGSAIASTTSRDRLTNPAANGRVDFWDVAFDAWRDAPAGGAGAGSFQTLWLRHRPDTSTAVDAHSLYAEVAGELGLVGLLLVVAMVLLVLGRLASLCRGPERGVYAAALGAATVWAIHAGLDWDWELPAVTVPFFALGGLALAAHAPRSRAPGRGVRLGAGLAILVVAVTPILIARSQARLNESVAAFRAGDCARATDAALDSLATLGLRPEPFELIAYCDARTRGLGALGVRMMEAAVRRDPDNWEFRYGLALVRGAARSDPRPAARAAQALNPREPLTRTLVRRLRTRDPSAWERVARSAPLPYAAGRSRSARGAGAAAPSPSGAAPARRG